VFAALASRRPVRAGQQAGGRRDQDGLPNVLMEAGTKGRRWCRRTLPPFGEFIDDGVNGLLVSPGAPDELAARLAVIVGDPELRIRSGRAGDRNRADALFLRVGRRLDRRRPR
jgi:glycosyltransferase involved in cell wall biosynthesis